MPCRFDHNCFSEGLGQDQDVFAEAGNSVQRMPPAQQLRPVHSVGLRSWFAILFRMDVERIIDDIEQLEEMFEAPDIRPLSASDVSAANRRHDETPRQQSMVPALEGFWNLLPARGSDPLRD